jgi:ATP-binding cassette subfamily C (CFTR/MRP) protein 1
LGNPAYIFLGHIRVPVPLSYILKPLALLFAIFLTRTNHEQTRTSSSTPLLFWLAHTVGLLIWGRTLIAIHSENVSNIVIPLALRSAVTMFGLFSFTLELLAPKFDPDSNKANDKTHVQSLLISTNIFGKWSFDYLPPILKKGAKEYITDKDLPSLIKPQNCVRLDAALAK